MTERTSYGVCLVSTLPSVRNPASPYGLFTKLFRAFGKMLSSFTRMKSSRSGRTGVSKLPKLKVKIINLFTFPWQLFFEPWSLSHCHFKNFGRTRNLDTKGDFRAKKRQLDKVNSAKLLGGLLALMGFPWALKGSSGNPRGSPVCPTGPMGVNGNTHTQSTLY